MKKNTIIFLFIALGTLILAQSKTMIVYKNGVKQYEGLVSMSDSIAFNATDTVMDVEENVYRTIKIGNRLWMIDNLRTTKLNDGTPITNITTDDIKYANGVSGVLRTTPAFSWHTNLNYNKNTYGGLYNWFALETKKLAPVGWRVATKEDWAELESYLAANGFNYDGTKSTDGSVSKILKSLTSDIFWSSSAVKGSVGNNIKANNKSGLSLMPSGFRDGNSWGVAGNVAGYWTASMYDSTSSNSRNFSVADTGIIQTRTDVKQMAFAVRCVKDIVPTPVAGIIPDSHFTSLNSSFITRRDAAFEALRYNALKVDSILPPILPGLPNYAIDFSYSLLNYAFKCFWLNINIDKANNAIAQNTNYFLNTYNAGDLCWTADTWLKLLEYYGSKGTKNPGLIADTVETKLYQLMSFYLKKHSKVSKLEYVVSNTWDIWGTENIEALVNTTYWHFAKLLKDNLLYSTILCDDGFTVQQHYDAYSIYLKKWMQQRAAKSFLVETANDNYHAETLKGFYNLFDFSNDPELKDQTRKFLDLYWALWAQEQIDGSRGGAKARVYRGNESNGYDGDGARTFCYKMAYYYLATTETWALGGPTFTAVTSDYRMPFVAMDLALAKTEMGNFEIKDRPLGLTVTGYYNAPTGFYKPRQDYGGIVRYTYCTPDFIMGSMHLEARPEKDWAMISSQNRWQGVIFKGNPFCRIYPQAQKEYRSYNQHWSVQSKGCMIVQALTIGTYSKYTDTMRVYFSPQGLTGRIERSGWIFVQSNGAYAAVKCAAGAYYWDTPGGRWLVCKDRYSPVIIEVGQKKDFSSFTNFQDKILALPLTYDGKVLKHTSLYGDELVFYADKTSLPKINNQLIDLRPTRAFDSPFIKSDYNSGVVEISKNKRKLVLDFNLK